MKADCGLDTDTLYPEGRNHCQLPRSHRCDDCGATVCWQHIRQRCPKGRTTKYGAWQHLTREQKGEISPATQVRLKKAGLTGKSIRPELPQKLALTFGYKVGENEQRTLVIHPGAIHPADDGCGWEPDEELRGWLERNGYDANQTFRQKQDAVRFLLSAAGNPNKLTTEN